MYDEEHTAGVQLGLFPLESFNPRKTFGPAPVEVTPDKVIVTESGLMEMAGKVVQLVLRKNHDYGDAWQALGTVGAGARFVDKLFRIERLADGQEALVTNESMEDTISDLVGYGLLILLRIDGSARDKSNG